MLPGSFTDLLLQISNFTDLAAEDLAEALHLGIGERAAGGLVVGGRGRRGRERGRLRPRIADRHLDAIRPRSDLL
jgi:hypothetical protein